MSSSYNIFIVDDDDSVRRSLARLLRAEGLNALVFSSADEFLQTIPPETSGCLILDVRMPGMNGFELQDKLLAARSPLRVIFISAVHNSTDREQALQKGALGFLNKPFSDEELITLVHGSFRSEA